MHQDLQQLITLLFPAGAQTIQKMMENDKNKQDHDPEYRVLTRLYYYHRLIEIHEECKQGKELGEISEELQVIKHVLFESSPENELKYFKLLQKSNDLKEKLKETQTDEQLKQELEKTTQLLESTKVRSYRFIFSSRTNISSIHSNVQISYFKYTTTSNKTKLKYNNGYNQTKLFKHHLSQSHWLGKFSLQINYTQTS